MPGLYSAYPQVYKRFMGIFQQQKALAALSFRLGEMSTEIQDLKRANRSLELEFTELYDKVRHQMSRMAKRAAVAEKENIDAAEIPAIDGGPDPISAGILQRRGIRRQAE